MNNKTIWTPDISAATLAEWGDIDTYYPVEECTVSRRNAWATAEEEWEASISLAVDAAIEEDRSGCFEALAEASRIEREWGDDPATQHVRRALQI